MSLMHDALREMEKSPPMSASAMPTLTYDTSPGPRDARRAVTVERPRDVLENHARPAAIGMPAQKFAVRGAWALGAILGAIMLLLLWLQARPTQMVSPPDVSNGPIANAPSAVLVPVAPLAAAPALTAATLAAAEPMAQPLNLPTPAAATPIALASVISTDTGGLPSRPQPTLETAGAVVTAPLSQAATRSTVTGATDQRSMQGAAATRVAPSTAFAPPPNRPPAASAGVQQLVLSSDAETQRHNAARNAAAASVNLRFSAIARAIESGDEAEMKAQLSSLERELPATSLTLLRAQAWVLSSGANADGAAARAAYTAILARLPEDENALLNLSALELKAGKIDTARTLVSSALSANPDSPAARAAHQRIGAAMQAAQLVPVK